MKIKDIMNRNPITTSPNSSFEDVWKLIFEKRISEPPTVQENQKLLEIISVDDLFERLYPT